MDKESNKADKKARTQKVSQFGRGSRQITSWQSSLCPHPWEQCKSLLQDAARDRGYRAGRAPDHIYQSPSQVTFIPKQRHNEITVMVDFIIAPREQVGTPINFIEKEQWWLMNFCRDPVSCINKISRIDKTIREQLCQENCLQMKCFDIISHELVNL